jgi:hypothetical protein
MTDRIERARHLGEELTAAMDALGASTRGGDVVVFLDRLARLEGYTAEELAGVPALAALVEEAQAARTEHAAELGRAAGRALDLDQLLHKGRHLPADDVGAERDTWLRDVLLVATVAPWLSPARQKQASWALDKAFAMVEADADAFLDASVLVQDRRDLESPGVLGNEARAFLQILADLPLLVAFDRAPVSADAAGVKHALAPLPRPLRDVADDALTDHAARAALQLPAAATLHALAAADQSEGVLLRMEAGAWVLSQHRGSLTLRFEGAEDLRAAGELAVLVLDGAGTSALPLDDKGDFPLPHSDAGLTLRLRVGPDSRVVHLPGAAQ